MLTTVPEAEATAGEVEAEAEATLSKLGEADSAPTSEPLEEDLSSLSGTYPGNGTTTQPRTGSTVNVMNNGTLLVIMIKWGRETIPGEGIKQEPSPVHDHLLYYVDLTEVPREQETTSEHFGGRCHYQRPVGHRLSSDFV